MTLITERPGELTRGGLHPPRSRATMTEDELRRRHLALFAEIAAEPDAEVRARRATEELLRLETERGDFTALRDLAVHRLAADGYSYSRVGQAIGLTKDRAAQLVRRASDVHGTAAQHVAKVRRRARRA
jgi:hypothetical protein